MENTKKKVRAKELGLGDIVRTGNVDDGYSDATVSNILSNGTVQLRRPYIHTANFSYTGGVITYIGIEDFELQPNSEVLLLKKGRPLK